MVGKKYEYQIYSCIVHVPDAMSDYEEPFVTLLKYGHALPCYEMTEEENEIKRRALSTYLNNPNSEYLGA